MKYLTLILTLLAIMITNPAAAGWGHNQGRFQQRHYQGKHYYKHHKHKNKHRNDNAAYALGGLLVGGIIGAQLSRPVYQRPYGVNDGGYANPYPGNAGNSFISNAYGECFLITCNNAGERILTPVPYRNCQ